MAGRSHSVNVGIKADASDAVRELERLGDSVQGIQDTFTTFAGQAKMQLASFAADTAISLGQEFAGQVAERTLEVEAWSETIERNFGLAEDEIRSFAQGLESAFGVGESNITNQLGRLAEKLDLDGRNPSDLGIIKSIGELAGAINLYAPEMGGIEGVFEQLGNFLATGEAGQLEDYFGDLGDAGETLAERLDAITKAADPAFEAMSNGAYETQQALNELKAEWDELVTTVARAVNEIIPYVNWTIDRAEELWEVFSAPSDFLEGPTRAVGEFFGLVESEAPKTGEAIVAAFGTASPAYRAGVAIGNDVARAWQGAVATIDNYIGRARVAAQISPFSGPAGELATQGRAQTEFSNPERLAPNDPNRFSGSQGLIGDFGMGTSVTLHGREAIIPLNDPMARGALGGHTINVNVSVPVGADQVSTGRAIVEAIEAWQRATGGINYLSGLQSV